MNQQTVRRLFQRILPLVNSAGKSNQPCRLVTSFSPSFTGRNTSVSVMPTRCISYWWRQHLLILRARRKKEKLKNPERFTNPTPRHKYVDWNYNAELFAFGKRLSEDFDELQLREALTDESYIHKERKKQEELGLDPELLQLRNNNELSELGIELSRKFLTEFVQKEFPLFPEEGHKAIIKYLMSEEIMTKVASNLGLKDIILCEEYPPSDETFTRAFFAVIGALQKSSGDERTNKFVVDFLASLLCDQDVNDIWDVSRPWQMMVELAKERNLYPVEPRLIREAGKNTIHAVFLVGIYDKDKMLLGTGAGETLDIAQEMAARDVLKGFFNTRDAKPFEFQSSNIPFKLIPQVRNIHKSN